MKYSSTSVLFASFVLSSVVVSASRAPSRQEQSAKTSSFSLWNLFGSKKENQVAPAKAVVADTKNDIDAPWMLVSEDEEDFVFTEEPVAEGEIKAHRQQQKDQALKRHDERRLNRVKRAEEDEELRAWAQPHEPKRAAKWYQQTAPAIVLQEGEAVMMEDESEDDQDMLMFNPEEAILVEKGVEEMQVEEEQPIDEEEIPQPPPMDDEIPDAPSMDAVPLKQAPVVGDGENTQPNQPNLFRGKLVQKMGFAMSNEAAASAGEATLIQQFKARLQGASDRQEKKAVVDSLEQAVKKNPTFAELHKLHVQLRLQFHREVLEDDSGSESEENGEEDW